MMAKPKSDTTQERLMIERNVEFDEAKILDVPIADAVSFLYDLQAKHPDNKLFMSMDHYGYNSSDVSLKISYESIETDEEYNDRIKQLLLEQERSRKFQEMERKRAADFKTLHALELKLGIRR